MNESTTVLYFLNKAYADAYSKCLTNDPPVTSVSLSEIVDDDIIKSDAVISSSSIRIVPDMSQIQNALALQRQININNTNKNKNKHVVDHSFFHGVPIFQSDALRVMVQGHPNSYCPAFFNKADITKALRQVKELKHTKTQIQVTALEHIIEEMKEGSTNKWGDIFFIPPGNGQILE
ncbi:hypothetical protein C2S52_003847 [Perilla frutescens var. hirtella]|nr:hypothetical protein C2S51_011688 [Perilla frutescens var. frutescens]KAH6793370.1 hypothetical protein C2S52_003847 [Perilla frutescens var. hirtella]